MGGQALGIGLGDAEVEPAQPLAPALYQRQFGGLMKGKEAQPSAFVFVHARQVGVAQMGGNDSAAQQAALQYIGQPVPAGALRVKARSRQCWWHSRCCPRRLPSVQGEQIGIEAGHACLGPVEEWHAGRTIRFDHLLQRPPVQPLQLQE